ncbi:MAG TPA: hypothetical protein VHN14_11725 [Kofleriaceae bacterium]|nr:hypothetical protein [Kofleriaceae bacterium]
MLGLLPVLLNAADGHRTPGYVVAVLDTLPKLESKPPDFAGAFKQISDQMPCRTVVSSWTTDGEFGCVFKLIGMIWNQKDLEAARADPQLGSWLTSHPRARFDQLSREVARLVKDSTSSSPGSAMAVLVRIVAILQNYLDDGDLKNRFDAIRIALAERGPALAVIVRVLPFLFRSPRDLTKFFGELAQNLPCGVSGKEQNISVDQELGCAMRLLAMLWGRRGVDVDKAIAEVSKDPEMHGWIDARASDRLKGVWNDLDLVAADLDRLDSFEILERLTGALHHNLNNTIVISAIEARLGPLRERYTGVARLAYVIFYAGRALIRGENAAQVVIAATQQMRCDYTDAMLGTVDLSCALALSGVTLGVFLETRDRWAGPKLTAAKSAGYLGEVEKRIARVLALRSDGLLAWTKYRFGEIGRAALSTHERQDIRTFTSSLLETAISFETLLPPRGLISDDRDADAAKSAAAERVERLMMVGTSFFRSVIENAVVEPSVRKRALRILEHSSGLVSATYHRKLPSFAAELYALAEDLGMPEPLPASMREYLPLVTALASASTAEEVKSAFEKYAAAPDAYKKKRAAGSHVSISGIVAGSFGVERGFGGKLGTGGSTGLFVPVGLDVVWGGCRACGLFASILDLGSVASLHLSSDDATAAKDATWSQVLAPGLSFRMAIGGPFVWGVGASIASGIRQDSSGESQTIWRVLGYLGVDVAILPF